MLIYCDSAILIYYYEGIGSFKVRAIARMAALAAASDQIAVSDLTRLECRMKPIRLNAAATLAVYDGFFARPDIRLISITSAMFERATGIRAAHNFSVTDSLHLAAAVESGCGLFLTNDARLSRFPDIPIEILP